MSILDKMGRLQRRDDALGTKFCLKYSNTGPSWPTSTIPFLLIPSLCFEPGVGGARSSKLTPIHVPSPLASTRTSSRYSFLSSAVSKRTALSGQRCISALLAYLALSARYASKTVLGEVEGDSTGMMHATPRVNPPGAMTGEGEA